MVNSIKNLRRANSIKNVKQSEDKKLQKIKNT